MAQTIVDGQTKNTARVNTIFRLETDSISKNQGEFQSQVNGEVFVSTTGKTNTLCAPNGIVFYIKNTDPDRDIIIESLQFGLQNAGAQISFQKNDTGTPATTTELDKTNVNFGSGKTATADIYTSSGTGITGLADGEIIATLTDLPAGMVDFTNAIGNTFVLKTNDILTLHIQASAGGAQTGRVSFCCRYAFIKEDI